MPNAFKSAPGQIAPDAASEPGKPGGFERGTACDGGSPVIYHGTPMTPRDALYAVMPGRAGCVSFGRPDDVGPIEEVCPLIMYDNGAFKFWNEARRKGQDWACSRDWSDYYSWLEPRLFRDGRDAVIPDTPAAPSQINDGLLNEWPFGNKGLPVWHMDGPIDRLGRLCDRFPVVCLGWVGETKEDNVAGSYAFHRRMEDVSALMGNVWHPLHMLRGVAVARDYPFRKGRQYRARSKRMEARQFNRPLVWRSMERAA